MLTSENFNAIIQSVFYMYLKFLNHIILIMWFFLFSAPQKSEMLYLPAVDFSRFHCVNSCCVYAWMSQNVRKTDNIFLQWIKRPREKMTEIVRKNFRFVYVCAFAQVLKHFPDIAPIERISVFGNKHRTAFYPLRFDVFFQHTAKLFRQKHLPDFALAVYNRLAVFHRVNRHIPYFRHAESRARDCLH